MTKESYLEAARQRFESMSPERRASLEEWLEQCLRQRRMAKEYRDWLKTLPPC